jgi:glycosyltransferase involved in cell wall biosynthesis
LYAWLYVVHRTLTKYELQKECLSKLQNKYYHLSKFSIQKADYIICISKGLQHLFEGFPGAEDKISTIYYGYTAPLAAPEIQPSEYLLYIGRLIPFKHPEMLIQAYIQYRNSGGHLPLRIAGDGPEAIPMQQALKDAGYQQDVLFMGRIPRPEDLLSRAACLCVSSFSEGFGLVILEAMAAGVPVLAFDGPAMNETIHHGMTGTLCPIGDVHAFAQAMQKYSQHPEIRAEHGKMGWEKLSTMRIDTMATQTLSLYKRFGTA